jgi:hypothetical protein
MSSSAFIILYYILILMLINQSHIDHHISRLHFYYLKKEINGRIEIIFTIIEKYIGFVYPLKMN